MFKTALSHESIFDWDLSCEMGGGVCGRDSRDVHFEMCSTWVILHRIADDTRRSPLRSTN